MKIFKPSYMSQKIFNNDLAAVGKSNVTLTLNKANINWHVHIRFQ